jgi:catechol 2,3-dioxygenase-like lactoylglutathione lyase family enzyme
MKPELPDLSDLRGEHIPANAVPITLDHVTLRTGDLEGTKSFLEAVLDLTSGYRLNFSFPGYWLYSGGEPLVHLIPVEGGPDRAGEAIDHVGFRLIDHDFHLAKLDRMGIAYSRMELRELGERRLFLRTPGGILLELVFRDRRERDSSSKHQQQGCASQLEGTTIREHA